MVEWFKALVLKTSEVQASVGSNPTLSATILPRLFRRVFYYGSAMLYFEYGEKELNYLKKKDKRLAAVIEKAGVIQRELYPDIFVSLVNSIAGQQISRHAKASVWRRFTELLGGAVTPQAIDAVTEEQLRTAGEIPTAMGETLSWPYLCWVREHPLHWKVPTQVLYADTDPLTGHTAMEQFRQQTGAHLTILEGGEHWFHTETQLAALQGWESCHI